MCQHWAESALQSKFTLGGYTACGILLVWYANRDGNGIPFNGFQLKLLTTEARLHMHKYSACAWHAPDMHMQASSEADPPPAKGTAFGIVAASLRKTFLLFTFLLFTLPYFSPVFYLCALQILTMICGYCIQ